MTTSCIRDAAANQLLNYASENQANVYFLQLTCITFIIKSENILFRMTK